jgi:hypothetical protein
MAVVVLLEGVGAERFTVTVSPAAELAAALHVLTERAHHPAHTAWADAVLLASTPELRAGLRRFAPLWTAVRWRGFYPGLGAPPGAVPPAGLPERFAELTAYACASGYSGFDFTRIGRDPAQAALLRQTAARLP